MSTYALIHGAYGCGAVLGPLAAELEARGQSVSPYSEVCPLDRLPRGRYVVCREDHIISAQWGRRSARRLLGGDAVELDGGHFPQLTRPAQLAGVLRA